jgi:hypothetical protein
MGLKWSTCSTVRRPASTAPVALISSRNSLDGPDGAGPDGGVKSPYHSCNRMNPSPPGLPGSSFGAAMYPSTDIDM